MMRGFFVLRNVGMYLLKNYPNLRRLSIVEGSFTDISPIAEMKQLVYLQLDSDVMDIDISLLSDMKLLTDLNVMRGSGDPSFLKDFHNLKLLGLQNCNVSDIGFLSEITELKRLLLNNNTITDLSPIKNLTMLENLHVFNNQISDLSPVRNLDKLKQLRIGRNPITDLSPISGLKNLTELEAYNTDISDFSIAEAMPDLKIIR